MLNQFLFVDSDTNALSVLDSTPLVSLSATSSTQKSLSIFKMLCSLRYFSELSSARALVSAWVKSQHRKQQLSLSWGSGLRRDAGFDFDLAQAAQLLLTIILNGGFSISCCKVTDLM